MVIINGRRFAIDPIHEEHGQWYLWQETWADKSGPFDSRSQAEAYLQEYCKVLDRDNEKSLEEPTEEEDIAELKKILKECVKAGFMAGFHSGMLEQHKRLWPEQNDHKPKSDKEYWQERKDELGRGIDDG